MADQSASLVGECCFAANDVKVTLGTGAFLEVISGFGNPIAVTDLVFPIITYKIDKKILFATEIYLPKASYMGETIDFLVKNGYVDDLKKLDEIANSVSGT